MAPEYLGAQKKLFPNSRTFVLGGCIVGDAKTATVSFCGDCREAEQRWQENNPEFNQAANVFWRVQRLRRDLPDSIGKRLLLESQLKSPEKREDYLWLVFKIGIRENVLFDARSGSYVLQDDSGHRFSFDNLQALAEFLSLNHV
jgi:hypothetical protein